MPIKRRGFVKGLLVATPALPLLAQQPPAQTQTPAAPNPQPPREPPTRAFGGLEKLATVQVDVAADTTQRFFTVDQFTALEKLGEVMVPPLGGKPGATQAGSAVFLDFLIKESPHDRQMLYRRGLDGLNASAHKHFGKTFANLEAAQADSILKPLLVIRPWPEDMPEEPMQHFIAQAHQDLHTATSNSREWATASTSTGGGRRGFNQAIGLYWNPIDPVVKG